MGTARRSIVAVVDDDHRALESLADLLEAAGYDVRLYSSGRMLLQRGHLSEIDCLISDIGMPDMDGFELRRLALTERPGLPVILITGRPDLRTHQVSTVQDGRYFEKPFDGQHLLAAVRAAVATATEKGG